jgi:protein-S-isoprenylcysteine O-methyltransferase
MADPEEEPVTTSDTAPLVSAGIQQHARPLLGFLAASFGLGLVSDLSYLYPTIHLLKLIGFIIAMAILINLSIIETFVIDNNNFGFLRIMSINFAIYIFGMISYYTLSNLHYATFPYLDGICYFILANIVYFCGEFAFVCLYQAEKLKWSSFLANFSFAWLGAMGLSVAEFGAELQYELFDKNDNTYMMAGVVILAFGLVFRIGAFLSAGKNFVHNFSEYQRPEEFVTGGLYSVSRHPAYFGWFLFIIGGQVLLMNPICGVIFSLMSIRFFYGRIKFEEYTSLSFFGPEYQDYINRTPILIPCIETFLKKSRAGA